MEEHATEGESPVCENSKHLRGIPSIAGHGKSCENLARPWAKAKYESLTESGQVPRGKVEKNPGEGSEIEPEIMDLQAVGALCPRFGGERGDGVPFA